MKTLTGYHDGETYFLDPPGAGATLVTVVLGPDVEVRPDARGERKVFRAGQVLGYSLTTALVLNWCRIVEEAR